MEGHAARQLLGHPDMEGHTHLLGGAMGFLRRCLFRVLSFGPMPTHIAFIMDGNRRFSRHSRNMEPGGGHQAGFMALISSLQYCYEMGVRYVTVYAFSVDNFRRKPEEVEELMALMVEKIESLLEEESVVARFGVRINFWGNLGLLSEPVRSTAERAMTVTEGNTGPVLSVCIAYTSTDEITRAVGGLYRREKLSRMTRGGESGGNWIGDDGEEGCVISVMDVEKYLDTAGCPDPDLVIRTSGETRLSNFLLWQTTSAHLQSPAVLWPEFSLRHLVWAILEYQRAQPYLERRKEKKDCLF